VFERGGDVVHADVENDLVCEADDGSTAGFPSSRPPLGLMGASSRLVDSALEERGAHEGQLCVAIEVDRPGPFGVQR
jgi:hypothetical protein